MSTFNGVVDEFPDIRIDYFRQTPHRRPPLALFLSHVHSDHLLGLDTCRAPFIYCSPATRDILLRLEKYSHRMNFAREIIESRVQTYRHLKTLLKAVALDTPTEIEISPGLTLRVTLIDANHCVGAVMFLIEGGGKAVLYTGDIRAEPWWVNALTRHPVLMPYVVLGDQKRLDAIYLDTTFAVKEDTYREFPSKAAGVEELLQKVALYPPSTLFYFQAWTFGYEDVWRTLSAFLRTQIHVNDYRYRLYCALANGVEPKAPEAEALAGFPCANRYQSGCLTRDFSRIHSCEKGTECDIWDQDFVYICPIITRHDGIDIAEAGAGSGHGDLNQRHELELPNPSIIDQLMKSRKPEEQDATLNHVLAFLSVAANDSNASVPIHSRALIDECNPDQSEYANTEDLNFERFVGLLSQISKEGKDHSAGAQPRTSIHPGTNNECANHALPKTLHFPYSRHSSYGELCNLIGVLKPRDIYPCVVDYDRWSPKHSMGFVFGHLYKNSLSFRHDQMMLKKFSKSSSARTVNGNECLDHQDAPAGVEQQDHTLSGPTVSNLKRQLSQTMQEEIHDGQQLKKGSGKRTAGFNHGYFGDTDHDVDQPSSNEAVDSNEKLKSQCQHEMSKDHNVNRGHDSRNSVVLSLYSGVETDEMHAALYETSLTCMEEASQIREEGQLRQHISRSTTDHDSKEILEEDSALVQRALRLPAVSQEHRLRMAMRQETYDAVLGVGDMTWAEVGLISVHGHQEKEIEL